MLTAIRSHAKINLGLGIGAPRADGFHALATVYQTLEVYDTVTVAARPAAATVLRLTSNNSHVPTDGRNTAWKMVVLALEALGITAEVEIHIEKRLPVQGGLGAGSANAVAALVGLEAELGIEAHSFPHFEQTTFEGWGTEFMVGGETAGPSTAFVTKNVTNSAQDDSVFGNAQDDSVFGNAQDDSVFGNAQDDRSLWPARRMEIAAQVGSDVPLFLIGGAVLGLDRGQQVSPLPNLEPVWCVVATPEIGVSTPQAFRDWDALCAAESLTAQASADRLKELSRAYVSAFAGSISGSVPEGRQGAGSSGVLLDEENLAGPMESALVRTGITSWIVNDFERVVFPQHPSLAEIKRILLGSGTPEAALYASLSGSGSALYGLYRTRGDAEAARERLQAVGVTSLLTRTLPRAKYWREMLLP